MLYNPQAELIVSADAFSFRLGAVLFQKEGDNWKPVAYASRSMSEKRRYAQIEKEALAVTWACEKLEITFSGGNSRLSPTTNLSFHQAVGRYASSYFEFQTSICLI